MRFFRNKSSERYFKKLLREYIYHDNARIILFGDTDSGKIIETGLASRDTHYTELLENYKRLTRARNVLKEIHKWIFFWLIVVACALVVVFLIHYINDMKNTINEHSVAVVTAIVSLITTVISVPIIITKYLFNTKEDDNIAHIISKTQEHDKAEIELLIDRFKNEQKPCKKSVTSPNKEGAVHNKSKKSNKEKEIDALKEMLQ